MLVRTAEPFTTPLLQGALPRLITRQYQGGINPSLCSISPEKFLDDDSAIAENDIYMYNYVNKYIHIYIYIIYIYIFIVYRYTFISWFMNIKQNWMKLRVQQPHKLLLTNKTGNSTNKIQIRSTNIEPTQETYVWSKSLDIVRFCVSYPHGFFSGSSQH